MKISPRWASPELDPTRALRHNPHHPAPWGKGEGLMPATEMKVPSGYSDQTGRHHNIRFGIFTGALVAPVAIALGWHLVSRHRELAQAAPELLLWAAVLVLLNALDIRTARGARLAADIPIAAAA